LYDSNGTPPPAYKRDLSSMRSILRKRTSPFNAFGIVILLWACYTALQTLFVTGYVSEPWSAVLGFVPGVAGVVALKAAGQKKEQLFLQVAPLSRAGFLVLAAIFIIGLAVVLPFGQWQGWNWMAACVYAPASGISQELFFRAALLPAMLTLMGTRPRLALGLHALLFGLWHIGPLFLGAPAGRLQPSCLCHSCAA
jgi:membrane protease YdiL (CAAX protease family)